MAKKHVTQSMRDYSEYWWLWLKAGRKHQMRVERWRRRVSNQFVSFDLQLELLQWRGQEDKEQQAGDWVQRAPDHLLSHLLRCPSVCLFWKGMDGNHATPPRRPFCVCDKQGRSSLMWQTGRQTGRETKTRQHPDVMFHTMMMFLYQNPVLQKMWQRELCCLRLSHWQIEKTNIINQEIDDRWWNY